MAAVSSSYSELLAALCPHPDLKLVRVRYVPQMPTAHQAYTRYEWAPLVKTALEMADAGAHMEEGYRRRSKSSALAATNASSSSGSGSGRSLGLPFSSSRQGVVAGRRVDGEREEGAHSHTNKHVSRLVICHGEDLASGVCVC